MIALLLALLAGGMPASGMAKVSFTPEDALLKKPRGDGPFPMVILLHTCGGIQPHTTVEWPKDLLDEGYVVLTA